MCLWNGQQVIQKLTNSTESGLSSWDPNNSRLNQIHGPYSILSTIITHINCSNDINTFHKYFLCIQYVVAFVAQSNDWCLNTMRYEKTHKKCRILVGYVRPVITPGKKALSIQLFSITLWCICLPVYLFMICILLLLLFKTNVIRVVLLK